MISALPPPNPRPGSTGSEEMGLHHCLCCGRGWGHHLGCCCGERLLEEGGDLTTILLVLNNVRGLGDRLDARFVHLRRNPEEAVLSPVWAPAVLDPPVLLALLLAPTDEEHRVIDALPLLVTGMQDV